MKQVHHHAGGDLHAALIAAVSAETGAERRLGALERVGGGCIHQAALVAADGGERFFVKYGGTEQADRHVLNHLLLFGAGYAASAARLIERLLAQAGG